MIKRYDQYFDDMEEDAYGDYVKWEDVKEYLRDYQQMADLDLVEESDNE